MNATRFLCCNLAINKISFLNSTEPCLEPIESLLTAIYRPSARIPYKYKQLFIKEYPTNINNYLSKFDE